MKFNGRIDNPNHLLPMPTELEAYLLTELKEGVDYGKIEGYAKPTLFKPGAEKICRCLNLSIAYTVEHRYEDWEKGLFLYEMKVCLHHRDSGAMMAEGIGSANTKEAAFTKPDGYTHINTVLKMAKKRALVDAALNVSASSGYFTQDIEDYPREQAVNVGNSSITKRQLTRIHQLVAELQMKPETARELIKASFQVDHSTKLNKIQASRFIQDLQLLLNG